MGMQNARRRGGVLRTTGTFALGAGIGSLIALLYAPASGRVTRRRLTFGVRNLQRAAIRQLGQTRRVLRTQARQVGQVAKGWLADRFPHANGKVVRRRVIRHAHAA